MDYGTIKVLDFKRPDSSYYQIRFLFEEDYCRLHIAGDLGSLTAANCTNMTYEKFAEDYAGNPGYFREKVECHNRPFFVFDENMVKASLKEYLDESGVLAEVLRDGRMDWETDDDKLNDFLRMYFLILRMRKGSDPPDMRLWNGTFRIRGNLLPRSGNRKRTFWNCTCMPFRWQKHRSTRERIHSKRMETDGQKLQRGNVHNCRPVDHVPVRKGVLPGCGRKDHIRGKNETAAPGAGYRQEPCE